MGRIGIDARLLYYRTGGISTYTRMLVQALAEYAPTLDLTVFSKRGDEQKRTDHFSQRYLWTPAHHRLERSALSIELAWRALDVWHSPDFIPPHRAARRHVITVHDLTFLHYPDYLTAASRRYYNDQIAAACQHADHIFAVSDATKHDLIAMLRVPQYKITVQPHGVARQFQPLPSAEYRSILRLLDLPEPYLLHVGTWEPRKNIAGLAQAYKQLLTTMPDAPPLLLVGKSGWLFEAARSEIDALDLGERIIWRDNVSDAQLPAVYNGALALIAPSFYEGFGMPVLEAMACGVVPIVSDRSALPEVVAEVGLQVNPERVETITEALLYVLKNPGWRADMQGAARARAAHFTWERSAKIALATYTSLL